MKDTQTRSNMDASATLIFYAETETSWGAITPLITGIEATTLGIVADDMLPNFLYSKKREGFQKMIDYCDYHSTDSSVDFYIYNSGFQLRKIRVTGHFLKWYTTIFAKTAVDALSNLFDHEISWQSENNGLMITQRDQVYTDMWHKKTQDLDIGWSYTPTMIVPDHTLVYTPPSS